jgi:RNA polymerase sigma-70 factor (ECF subfamily)
MSVGLDAEPAASSFEDWVRPPLPLMLRVATSLTATSHDAEDLVQDSLLRAWRKRTTFDPLRGSAQAWLTAVVTDQAKQRWRRRDAAPEWRLPEQPTEEYDLAVNLDLRAAINSLTPARRQVVILYYYIGLPIADIAHLLQRTTSMVKSALFDARHQLANQLGENDHV